MHSHDLLHQALAPTLQHLPVGDAIALARVSKSLRAAVLAAWRPRPFSAVIAASLSSRLLLLEPHSGETRRLCCLGSVAVELSSRHCIAPHRASTPAALPLAGRVLQAVDIASPPAAQDDGEEGGGSWAPCVEVDPAGGRVFVSQYEARGPWHARLGSTLCCACYHLAAGWSSHDCARPCAGASTCPARHATLRPTPSVCRAPACSNTRCPISRCAAASRAGS